jgi:hypothetical protein
VASSGRIGLSTGKLHFLQKIHTGENCFNDKEFYEMKNAARDPELSLVCADIMAI